MTTGQSTCDAAYGHNPDRCYYPAGHAGTHSNRWGTTWARDEPMTRAELHAARARTQGEPDPRPTAEEAPDA